MTEPLRAALDAERLSDAMSDAYTYEDRDNNVPTLPFHDDFRAFWTPFAEKVLIALAADAARPDAIDESRNATLDEVVRVVERLDGIVVLGGNAIANVHEPTREAVLDAVKALRP